jgi:hypothetical protein
MDCLQGQERSFRLSAEIRRLGSAASLVGPKKPTTFKIPEWLFETGNIKIIKIGIKQEALEELMDSIFLQSTCSVMINVKTHYSTSLHYPEFHC